MYLHLPSNASMDLFPNNTLQNYTTQLSVASEFTGRWEVGLYEIMYPRMWYNVTEEDVKCHVMFSDKPQRNVCCLQEDIHPWNN